MEGGIQANIYIFLEKRKEMKKGWDEDQRVLLFNFFEVLFDAKDEGEATASVLRTLSLMPCGSHLYSNETVQWGFADLRNGVAGEII